MINIYEVITLIIFLMMIMEWKQKKRLNNNFFFIGTFLIFCLEAFRSTTVGGDTDNYTSFFMGENTSGYGYLYDNYKNFDIEVGYVIINRFLANICHQEWWFVFSSSFLILFPIFYRIYKYNIGNKMLSLCMFMTMYGFLSCSVTSLRQNFGISFMILALYLLRERPINNKKILYSLIALSVLASLNCHSSMYITIVLLAIIYYIPLNRKIALISMISCMIIPISMNLFFGNVMNIISDFFQGYAVLDRSLRYSGGLLTSGEFGLEKVTFFALAPSAIFVTSFIMIYTKKEFERYETKCLIFGQCLFMLGKSFPMVVRTILGITIIGMVAVPFAFRNFQVKKNNIRLYNWSIVVMMLFFIWQMFVTFDKWDYSTGGGGSDLLPYQFIWD